MNSIETINLAGITVATLMTSAPALAVRVSDHGNPSAHGDPSDRDTARCDWQPAQPSLRDVTGTRVRGTAYFAVDGFDKSGGSTSLRAPI